MLPHLLVDSEQQTLSDSSLHSFKMLTARCSATSASPRPPWLVSLNTPPTHVLANPNQGRNNIRTTFVTTVSLGGMAALTPEASQEAESVSPPAQS